VEARLAIEDGARELDMVMNVGKFLSGDLDWVQRDIEAVVAEARKHPGVLVKVILETCYLSLRGSPAPVRSPRRPGADFVKTSTGFGDGPATPEAVQIMHRDGRRDDGDQAVGRHPRLCDGVPVLGHGSAAVGDRLDRSGFERSPRGVTIMQAVRYYAPGDIRIEEVPTPEASDGELRVRVDACAVCGTD
jgi:hypothetical protein